MITEIETKKTDSSECNSDCDEQTGTSEPSLKFISNSNAESDFDTESYSDTESDWDQNLEALKKKILEKDISPQPSSQKIDRHKIFVKNLGANDEMI